MEVRGHQIVMVKSQVVFDMLFLKTFEHKNMTLQKDKPPDRFVSVFFRIFDQVFFAEHTSYPMECDIPPIGY